jgi:hypothetical protein
MRPLGYELTGPSFASPRGSQTCRSRLIDCLGHHGAFRAVSAVTPRFVHKSIHNTHADVGSIGWQ